MNVFHKTNVFFAPFCSINDEFSEKHPPLTIAMRPLAPVVVNNLVSSGCVACLLINLLLVEQ